MSYFCPSYHVPGYCCSLHGRLGQTAERRRSCRLFICPDGQTALSIMSQWVESGVYFDFTATVSLLVQNHSSVFACAFQINSLKCDQNYFRGSWSFSLNSWKVASVAAQNHSEVGGKILMQAEHERNESTQLLQQTPAFPESLYLVFFFFFLLCQTSYKRL